MKVKTRLFSAIGLLIAATLVVTGLLVFATVKSTFHQKRARFCHSQLDAIYELQSNVVQYIDEINDMILFRDNELEKYENRISTSLAALDLISGREQEFLSGGDDDLDDVEQRLPQLLFLTSEIRKIGTQINGLMRQKMTEEALSRYEYLSEEVYEKQFVKVVETAIADEKVEVAQTERTAFIFSQNIKKSALLVALSTVVIVGIFVAMLILSIEKSLQLLDDATKKVSRGIFSARIDIGGKDEFSELAGAFNLMTDELESRENLLKQSNAKLQLEVVERRQAEEAANKARREAENANRVKSDFLANMSHEIRTPMNGIIGFTDMLLKMKLGEKQRKFLQLVKISADRLLAVINDILDFSKIEAEKLSLESANFKLRNALDTTMGMLKLKAVEKKLDLNWRVDDDVPDELIGDEGRVCQVLINLVSNAIKFTDRGRVEVRVKLAQMEADMASVYFSVSDSGPGIPPDKQKQIFDAFSQADGTHARKFGGTGLGLTISSRLVDMMGGKIWVDSVENDPPSNSAETPMCRRGTTFHFTIRFGIMEIIDDNGFVHEHIAQQAKIEFDRKLKILLAEDDKINQIFAREILSQQGLHVTAVGNGMMAVEAMRHNDYDLILMDIQMPEMDGYEATYTIRKFERETNTEHTPIVAMTAHAMKGDAEKCLAAGMDDFIPKPVDPDELFAVIKRQTEKYNKNNQLNTSC